VRQIVKKFADTAVLLRLCHACLPCRRRQHPLARCCQNSTWGGWRASP